MYFKTILKYLILEKCIDVFFTKIGNSLKLPELIKDKYSYVDGFIGSSGYFRKIEFNYPYNSIEKLN